VSDARDPAPPSPPPGGEDGVRVMRHARRRGGWIAVIAIAVVGGGWLLGPGSPAPPPPGHATPSVAPGADAPGARPASTPPGEGPTGRTARAVPVVHGEDPTPDLSDYVHPGEAPTMAEVIAALHRRGIRTGLGAFQPHGTSPPLMGLEVPDGFALPAGYVRHHQATDDGQRIPPILMFHPDVRHVDVGGRRVAVPPDRVVPPDLAPPGMPRRPVRIPPPRDGSGGP